MIPGRQYSPDELIAMAWARKWWVLVSAALVSTITIVASSTIPDRFRAETLILAAPQSVSADYVRNTVATDTKAKDRLPSIRQQILSRSRLQHIIESLDLYAGERRAEPMEVVVGRMHGRITIEPAPGSDTFRVSFVAEDPRTATLVTEKLAALFIEENSLDRTTMARETSAFLESQLEDARKRLVQQEARLEAYRLQHGPELPTQLQSNIQVIQNTQSQLQSVAEAINRDRDRRLLVARQLADLQSEQQLLEPAGAPVSQPGSAAVQLETARAELRALELRLTAQHPDLVRARQNLATLERRAAEETAAAAASAADVRSRPPSLAEIARRNKINDLLAEIESLDRQVAAKSQKEAELQTALDTYQARVEAVPTRESELIAITRDYDTLQGLYRTLLTKKEDSKIAENLEQRQVIEQFKILDPPHLPERPFSPNRPLIAGAGTLAGLLAGLGLAALLEYRDKTVKVEADLRASLDLPVLAMIPRTLSAGERARARWRGAMASAALAGVFVLCAAAIWITIERLRP